MELTTGRKRMASMLAFGIFLGTVSVMGMSGMGLASNGPGPFQIEQGRVSGRVTQLPLKILLDQFHEQLGIDYKVAHEELATLVSVDLQQASIQEALDKILRTWDFALKMDREGQIQHIFVVRKIRAGGAEEQTIKAERMQGLTSPTPETEEPWAAMADAGVDLPPMSEGEEFALGDALQSPTWDEVDPELHITQMSEEEQQAILQSIEAPTGDSFDPERDITHMSDEEQQAIIQAIEFGQ